MGYFKANSAEREQPIFLSGRGGQSNRSRFFLTTEATEKSNENKSAGLISRGAFEQRMKFRWRLCHSQATDLEE
ncbi:MAG: hypothetical protein OXT68_15210 [Chloroflexota bacterium]|nr:hypothetical protein [Chloroflexota bacterium]MDE2952099.1 hypothetical protein [Chloroflexota bacterium]